MSKLPLSLLKAMEDDLLKDKEKKSTTIEFTNNELINVFGIMVEYYRIVMELQFKSNLITNAESAYNKLKDAYENL
jgi:hypothetical protein